MYGLARPFLFALDAETAHGLGLKAIEAAYRTGLNPLLATPAVPLPTRVFGLDFANPIGLAAGLDKNGAYIDALGSLGFGFVEVGTTTPRPQQGNPRPRMFRLPQHEAVINRLGFNNEGVDALVRNAERAHYAGILGINIGKNKDTSNADAVHDYLACLRKVYARADYITVNVSSPNTQGLRELQGEQSLRALLAALLSERESLAVQHRKRVPLLVKIAPDLAEEELDAMATVFLDEAVDGVLATNTTVSRAGVEGHRHGAEPGGLSGRPLFARSTEVLRGLSERLAGSIPLIGVGGVLRGEDAAGKIHAGASLVQFYTGMIYRGPPLIAECIEALRACLPQPPR